VPEPAPADKHCILTGKTLSAAFRVRCRNNADEAPGREQALRAESEEVTTVAMGNIEPAGTKGLDND
jgi:hypothetical protein